MNIHHYRLADGGTLYTLEVTEADSDRAFERTSDAQFKACAQWHEDGHIDRTIVFYLLNLMSPHSANEVLSMDNKNPRQ